MRILSNWWHTWRQDRLLGSVIRNSGYLFSSNTAGMLLSSLTGLLVPLLLSPAEYGSLGIIISFASNVNRLLSFRMGELVIRYAGQHLAQQDKQQAAAVIKAAGFIEGATSIGAYLLLALLAPLAATHILKDASLTPLIIFYGLALLANLVTETSRAVLQISGHYRTQALLNLVQAVATAVLIVAAFLTHGNVFFILTAYLIGKLIYGMGMAFSAIYWSTPLLGKGWWRASIGLLADVRREMAHFAISTNLSGTINMVIRDSELLWVGYFLASTQAGYYKFAFAVINMVVLPIAPLIDTTFPEISKAVAQSRWPQLRSLLTRTSLISLVYTLAVAAGFILVAPFFLRIYGNGEYLPALPLILVLLLGYGFANVFFWNRPLLLAFGKPNSPLWITAAAGAVKTALMFVLVRPFGYLAQAGLLSAYFIFSIAAIVWRGLKELKQKEKTGPTPPVPAGGDEEKPEPLLSQ